MKHGRGRSHTPKTGTRLRVVAFIPAHNEAESIGRTILALLAQGRVPDHIVVIPNGCTDDTATIARTHARTHEPAITVLELPRLEHKKSQALNIAWDLYGRNADVLICLDADTVLPPNAIGDWEAEMVADPRLGGSSSKFTMLGGDFLTRLQRFEFARWTDSSLRRGWTSVLAGTGAAIRGEALRRVATWTGRSGPWSYDSQVEDFELTYQIRRLGYRCQVSPTVRAYTDSMKTIKALWGQRMKWQVGTVEDLMALGWNDLTRLDWRQQTAGLFSALMRVLWIVITIGLAVDGALHFTWYWWVIPPLIFVAVDIKAALVIPHRDRTDVLLAAALLPQEFFAWLRAAWFVAAWVEVLKYQLGGSRKDRWELQYAAEAA